jgi:hypothetical protein
VRGGLSAALGRIRADEGLSIKKAKRRLLRYVWLATSDGLQALKRKRRGLPYGLKQDRNIPRKRVEMTNVQGLTATVSVPAREALVWRVRGVQS